MGNRLIGMHVLLGVVVAALTVGSPFGSASAEWVADAGDLIEIRLRVEGPEASSVVAYVVDVGNAEQRVALVETGPGIYSGRVEVRPADLFVVFEHVPDGTQSSAVSLTQLGLDPGLLVAGGRSPVEEQADPEPDSGWGWIALAAGAASLSLLAFWSLGGDRGEDEPPDPT
jgi:hypothetical protein